MNKSSFSDCIQSLDSILLSEFVSVDSAQNPVARAVDEMSVSDLTWIVLQYSVFSRRIVSFLLDAYYIAVDAGWDELSSELRQNISEELGASPDIHGNASSVKYGSLPHFILLRRGFLAAYKIDAATVRPSGSTERFIQDIHVSVGDPDVIKVAGSVYALESSALPELAMVYGFVRHLFSKSGVRVPEEIRRYFEDHISEIEVLHRDRLLSVLGVWVDDSEKQERFMSGFRQVLSTMDSWWRGLLSDVEGAEQRKYERV